MRSPLHGRLPECSLLCARVRFFVCLLMLFVFARVCVCVCVRVFACVRSQDPCSCLRRGALPEEKCVPVCPRQVD